MESHNVTEFNSTDKTGFYATAPSMRYITFTIGGLGMTGNIFVVIVVINSSAMRKQLTNAYIMNQSIIDALASLVIILSVAIEDDGRSYHGFLGDLVCRMWFSRLPSWSLFISSTYNLVMLTTERYLSIMHPVWHKIKLTKKKVNASYNAALFLPTSGLTADGKCRVLMFWPGLIWQRVTGVLSIFILYIGPLFIFIILYTIIIVKLYKQRKSAASNATTGSFHQSRTCNSMDHARKNILKTLIIVVCCFILCWTLNQIYFLIFNLGGGKMDFTSVFYHFTVVMVFVNCCINPFIYAAKYKEFQKAMKRLFRKATVGVEITSESNTL